MLYVKVLPHHSSGIARIYVGRLVLGYALDREVEGLKVHGIESTTSEVCYTSAW